MNSSFYDILQVPIGATTAQIKAAYKRLAKEYHPDKNNGNKEAEEKFKRITEAYRTLSNAALRARYDASLHYRRHHASHTYSYNTTSTTATYQHTYTAPEDFTKQGKHYKHTVGKSISKADRDMYYFAITMFVILACALLVFGRWMNHYTASKHVEQAWQFLENGLISKAVIEAEQALQFNEKSAMAYYVLAQCMAYRNACEMFKIYEKKANELASDVEKAFWAQKQIVCP